MPRGWRLRISHNFLGRVYRKVLLRIISGAVTTREILGHLRRWRRKQEESQGGLRSQQLRNHSIVKPRAVTVAETALGTLVWQHGALWRI